MSCLGRLDILVLQHHTEGLFFFLWLVISILALFVFAGCEGLLPGGGELAGTSWKLSDWSDSVLDPSHFTITANFDASTLFGTSAINSYSGSYVAAASHHFAVHDLQMTAMGGSEEAMQSESIYFQRLGQAVRFSLDQETLTLLDAFNQEVLIFSRTAPVEELATVEEIDILIAESYPVQVFVVMKGYLPDTCTEIGPMIQNREGNTFDIIVKTHYYQQGDCICSNLMIPYTEIISLQVYGLPTGNYTVDVNGVQGSFTLEIDNVILPDK